MKKFCYFILLILFACSSPSENLTYDMTKVEKELSGAMINDTLISVKKIISTERSSTIIFYKSSDKLINEIDIQINTKQDSTFLILVDFYNKKFKSLKNDSIFNTWHTDSSEFILYKNSDSSILVNIFKRTYL